MIFSLPCSINGWKILYCIYTEQKKKKKKRNNGPPKIFEFNGKTLIISDLLLYDSHPWDIRVYHAKTDFHFDKNK